MVYQPVPDTCVLTIELEGANENAGSEGQFALYFEKVGGYTPANLQSINDAGVAWVSATYDTLLPDAWTVTRVSTVDLSEENGLEVSESISVTGARAGDGAPSNIAAWCKFDMSPGSMPKKGGVFVIGGTEADMNGNLWSGAFATEVDTAIDTLRGDVAAAVAGATHVVPSRYASLNDDIRDARAALRAAIRASRRATAITNTVNTIATRRLVASQRDRRPASST